MRTTTIRVPLLALILAASAGFGWEHNLHRQMVLDALALAAPEVKDYFTYGPCNIARYAENADLLPVSQGAGCTVKPVEERRREIETARAALWAATGPRAFDLHKLIHQVTDLFSPSRRMNCLADAPSFYEQNDINGFVLGAGTLDGLFADFTPPALHALVTRSDSIAYIVSVNAALRLMQDYYALRAGTPAAPSSAALYRVNFIKTAFGGQKLGRSYESTTPSSDGAYSYSTYNYYTDSGTAEDVTYVNQCSLVMLGCVAMTGEKGTLLLADFHNNASGPAVQANLLVNDQEVIVPLDLKGFGDALVYFAIGGASAPRSVRLVPPTNPVVRRAVSRGLWAATPTEVGVNGAVDSLLEMRLLLPGDITRSACKGPTPAAKKAQ